jgi:hypothetical protein
MKLSITWWLNVLCSAVLILYVGGCVDVNNADVSTVDLRSSVKFINLSTVGSGINVSVDNNGVINSLTYATNSTYQDIASGTRFFSVSYTGVPAILDTFRFALTPNYKFTYFVVCDPTGGDSTRSYLLYPERQTFNGTVVTVTDSLLVRFINLSNDTAASVTGGVKLHVTYKLTDTTSMDTSAASLLAFKGSTPYYQAPLSAKYFVEGTDGSILADSVAISSTQGRFSVVSYGFLSAGKLKTIVLKED